MRSVDVAVAKMESVARIVSDGDTEQFGEVVGECVVFDDGEREANAVADLVISSVGFDVKMALTLVLAVDDKECVSEFVVVVVALLDSDAVLEPVILLEAEAEIVEVVVLELVDELVPLPQPVGVVVAVPVDVAELELVDERVALADPVAVVVAERVAKAVGALVAIDDAVIICVVGIAEGDGD